MSINYNYILLSNGCNYFFPNDNNEKFIINFSNASTQLSEELDIITNKTINTTNVMYDYNLSSLEYDKNLEALFNHYYELLISIELQGKKNYSKKNNINTFAEFLIENSLQNFTQNSARNLYEKLYKLYSKKTSKGTKKGVFI